jgi:hypothetical protein
MICETCHNDFPDTEVRDFPFNFVLVNSVLVSCPCCPQSDSRAQADIRDALSGNRDLASFLSEDGDYLSLI